MLCREPIGMLWSKLVSQVILSNMNLSVVAWKIPWTEEPGRLQSMGSQRVGHDRATLLTYLVYWETELWERRNVFFFFFFLFSVVCGIQFPDDSVLCTGSEESSPLEHQGSPEGDGIVRPGQVKRDLEGRVLES